MGGKTVNTNFCLTILGWPLADPLQLAMAASLMAPFLKYWNNKKVHNQLVDRSSFAIYTGEGKFDS